jgi:hypothetical protein
MAIKKSSGGGKQEIESFPKKQRQGMGFIQNIRRNISK